MTEITRMNRTKQGRWALFCVDGFLFSLDEETLVRAGVGPGSLLSDADLAALRGQSDLRRAKDKALRLLAVRAHGTSELLGKLARTFDGDTAAAAVDEMARLGLLDDAAFAAARAEYMVNAGRKTLFQARQSLRVLGIAPADIEAALAPLVQEEGEAAAAEDLLRRKYLPRLARGEVQNVKAALARRGFSPRDIAAAVEAVAEELLPDEGQ